MLSRITSSLSSSGAEGDGSHRREEAVHSVAQVVAGRVVAVVEEVKVRLHPVRPGAAGVQKQRAHGERVLDRRAAVLRAVTWLNQSLLV